jgi:trigger factor
MVSLQLDDYCQEFAQYVAKQGMDPKKVNWQAYRQYRLNDAERAVRSGYLLQAIGNAEAIEVPEADIDAEIRTFMAENQVQQPFDAFKAELERRGNATEIKGRLRTDRIFNHLLTTAKVTEEQLDKAAFEALIELERKREAGLPVNRFDAGGLEGGDLEGQEGGEPAAVAPAGHIHGPDCDHDHEAEKKPVRPKQEAEAHRPKGGPEGAEPTKGSVKKGEPAAEEKPKKAAKAGEPEAEEKPRKASKAKEPEAEEKPKAKKAATAKK